MATKDRGPRLFKAPHASSSCKEQLYIHTETCSDQLSSRPSRVSSVSTIALLHPRACGWAIEWAYACRNPSEAKGIKQIQLCQLQKAHEVISLSANAGAFVRASTATSNSGRVMKRQEGVEVENECDYQTARALFFFFFLIYHLISRVQDRTQDKTTDGLWTLMWAREREVLRTFYFAYNPFSRSSVFIKINRLKQNSTFIILEQIPPQVHVLELY